MKYAPILDLALRHAYYADGKCLGLRVEPASATERMLRAHRCLARPRADGTGISITVDDSGKAVVPLSPDRVLVFHLVIADPDFVLFTDTQDIYGQPAPLYTNARLAAGGGGELTLGSREEWSSETLSVIRPDAAERFALSGRPRPGVEAREFEVAEPVARAAIVDYDEEASVLVVDTRSASRGRVLRVRYPVKPELPQGVLAAVEIHGVGGGQPAAGSVGLRITFQPEGKRWSYYCVTDLPATDDLQIVDTQPANGGDPLVFSPENRRDLVQEPDPTDQVAALLARQYAKLRRIRFLSDKPIPCRSAARSHLELRLGAERLSGPLPNPPLANFSTLDLPGPNGARKEASQFCIVKHLTRPLSNVGG